MGSTQLPLDHSFLIVPAHLIACNNACMRLHSERTRACVVPLRVCFKFLRVLNFAL